MNIKLMSSYPQTNFSFPTTNFSPPKEPQTAKSNHFISEEAAQLITRTSYSLEIQSKKGRNCDKEKLSPKFTLSKRYRSFYHDELSCNDSATLSLFWTLIKNVSARR